MDRLNILVTIQLNKLFLDVSKEQKLTTETSEQVDSVCAPLSRINFPLNTDVYTSGLYQLGTSITIIEPAADDFSSGGQRTMFSAPSAARGNLQNRYPGQQSHDI